MEKTQDGTFIYLEKKKKDVKLKKIIESDHSDFQIDESDFDENNLVQVDYMTGDQVGIKRINLIINKFIYLN